MPIINMIPAKSTMVVAAGTESVIVRKGIILYENLWAKQSPDDLFYQYRIEDDKITSGSSVELKIDIDYTQVAKEAEIQSTTSCTDGCTIAYAKNIPSTNIICDYVIQKEASVHKVYTDGSEIDLSKIPFYVNDEDLQASNAQEAIMKLKELLYGTVTKSIEQLTKTIEELGTYIVSNTTPEKTNVLWIDTGNGGIMKYYDSENEVWKPVYTVWG